MDDTRLKHAVGRRALEASVFTVLALAVPSGHAQVQGNVARDRGDAAQRLTQPPVVLEVPVRLHEVHPDVVSAQVFCALLHRSGPEQSQVLATARRFVALEAGELDDTLRFELQPPRGRPAANTYQCGFGLVTRDGELGTPARDHEELPFRADPAAPFTRVVTGEL